MTPIDWTKIQRRLFQVGFNLGPIDGIRGRLTVRAIKAFQRSQGLLPDGIVGPLTHAALFAQSEGAAVPSFDTMPWFDEANRLIGLKEDTSSASNPALLHMADDLDIDYASDDIPWCGLFVAHCVGAMLSDEPLPNNPLGARAWLGFGEPVSPQLGAILVFWRGKKSGWKGHVGFYAGEDPTHFHVLGGNQSDAVNIKRISRGRLLGARWPLTAGESGGVLLAGSLDVAETDGNEA